MRRRSLAILIACAFAAIPASAGAVPIHRHVEVTVHHHQLEPQRKHVDQDGLIFTRWTSQKEVVRVVHVPGTPPAPEPAIASAPVEAPAAPVTYSGDCGAIPAYIVECESGCNYAAQNPSGAYGAYQIMPDTASAYGCDMSTAAGQDACASEIYADQGAAPWSCG